LKPAQALAFGLASAWVSFPAGLAAAEESAVVESLERLDLNEATFEELCAIPGMTPAEAAVVLDRRATLGCLRSLEDLLGSGGLTELRLAALRPYVKVGGRCRGGVRVRGALAAWLARSRPFGSDSRAGELRIDRGSLRLRCSFRRGRLLPRGGATLAIGGIGIAAGDLLAPRAPPLFLAQGRDHLLFRGPLPSARRPSGGEPEALRVTTASRERVRGAGVALRGGAVALAGKFIDSWGRGRGGLLFLCVPLRGGCGFEGLAGVLRSPADAAWSVWSRAEMTNRTLCIIAQAGGGSSGGVWALSLYGRPAPGRALLAAAACGLGRYANPAGCRAFGRPGGTRLAWRFAFSQALGRRCVLRCERAADSTEGRGSRLQDEARLTVRVRRRMWLDCQLRRSGSGDSSRLRRTALKWLWRSKEESSVEVTVRCESDGEARSWVVCWRSATVRAGFAVEAGLFCFGARRSVRIYEPELLGLTSIKSLKGYGAGWYLSVRPHCRGNGNPLLGALELKLRAVSSGDPFSRESFFGVQLGGV